MDRALRLHLRPILGAFVDRIRVANNLEGVAHSPGDHPRDDDWKVDTQKLPNEIFANWNMYAPNIKPNPAHARNVLLSEVREARNLLAHEQAVSDDKALHYLYIMKELAKRLDGSAQHASELAKPYDAQRNRRPLGQTDERATSGSERATPGHNGPIGRYVSELLLDATLSFEQIVARVRQRFPTAATSTKSVASTARDLRKLGHAIPFRNGRTS